MISNYFKFMIQVQSYRQEDDWLFWFKNEFLACKEVLHWQIQTSACYLKHELFPDTETYPKHDLEEPLVVIK